MYSQSVDFIYNEDNDVAGQPIIAIKRKRQPGALPTLTGLDKNILVTLWPYKPVPGSTALQTSRKIGVAIGFYVKVKAADGTTYPVLFGAAPSAMTEISDDRGDYGYQFVLNTDTSDTRAALNATPGQTITVVFDIKYDGVSTVQAEFQLRPPVFWGDEGDAVPGIDTILDEILAASATFANKPDKPTNPLLAETDHAVLGQDARLKTLSIEAFGATTSLSDATTQIQAAINYAATNGLTLISGAAVYKSSQLSLPSNIAWIATGTTLQAVSGSNKALLVNANPTFDPNAVVDKNISIRGLTVDHDGANQADTESSGTWNSPIRFTGVQGLNLEGMTVLRPRRFSTWLTNVSRVRVDAVMNIDATVASMNKDGLHINGNSFDISGRVKIINGQDDGIALNADDGDIGGGYSGSNIAGPISSVKLDVTLVNCWQGVRLLSATKPIRNIEMTLRGDVSTTGVLAESFGLGSAAIYQDIIFNDTDLTYNPTPNSSIIYPLVKINTLTQATGTYSDFTFRRVRHVSGGTDAYGRPTIGLNLTRTIVRFGDIITDGTGDGADSAIIQPVQCTDGRILVDSITRVNSGTASVDIVQPSDSILDEVNVGFIAADKYRCAYLGYRTNPSFTSKTKTLTMYSPDPANGGALGTFYAGDYHTVDRSEVTGPFVQTYAGHGSGQRWGFSGVGSPAVTVDLPPYFNCLTSNRPAPASWQYGYMTLDSTLNKPIWWDGSAWRDATGATV